MKNKSRISPLILWIVTLLSVGSAHALSPVYTADLINQSVCIDTAPVLSVNQYQIGYLSFQTIASSAQYSASTFTDGRSSTGSITVTSNTNFTIRSATNSITIGSTASLASMKATDKITVSSNSALTHAVLTVNGTQLIEGRDWTKQGTATGTAVALKNLLDTFPGIDASTASNVVFTTAAVAGLGGNSFTMTSSTQAALTVNTANFVNGREQGLTNAVLTVNGTPYLNGYLWSTTDTSSGTAVSIASLLNNIGGVACSTSSSLVVVCTATVAGTAANSFTLASSTPTAMTVGSASYSGGRSTATVTINGVVLKNGVDWTTGSTSSATAKSISDAIMANSSLNTIITSTWNAAAIVTATSNVSGVVGNYSLATNIPASLTLSGSAMTGGSNINWVVNTPTITIASNGYSLGLAVLYSTSGSVGIGGLTNQTTYFVTPIDANNIKLSSSKANAVAGTYITLTSSVTNGQHTYTLTPVGLSGSASWKWQESNDNTNWADLNVSSVTFGSPYTSTSSFWDFGQINPVYLRLNFVSPTTGCVNLRARGNGK